MAGRGTISPREDCPRSKCRTWQLRVSLGRDPATGKYKRISRDFHGTYREAQKALAALIASDHEPVRSKAEFGPALRDHVERRRVADSTRAKLRSQAVALCMHLEHARLDQLTRAQIVAAFDALSAGNSPSGKPCSGTYLQGCRTLLGSFLEECEEGHRIASKARLMPPAIADTTKRKTALTDEMVASLVDMCRPEHDEHTCIMLALLAGLRRGECCRCLRWRDMDWKAGTIHVPGTKTKASDAVVPMVPQLADFLEARPRTSEYVVDLDPHAVTRWWARHRDALGLSGTSFHVLRHTYITMLARAGVHPSVMQALARHSDSRVTMEVYTHTVIDEQRAAAARMAARIPAPNVAPNNPPTSAAT